MNFVIFTVRKEVSRGDVCPNACWDTHTPLGRHLLGRHPLADAPHPEQTHPNLGRHTPSEQRPPPSPRRPLQRTVRILLGCNLVLQYDHTIPQK